MLDIVGLKVRHSEPQPGGVGGGGSGKFQCYVHVYMTIDPANGNAGSSKNCFFAKKVFSTSHGQISLLAAVLKYSGPYRTLVGPGRYSLSYE